jgi:hypothetical protein
LGSPSSSRPTRCWAAIRGASQQKRVIASLMPALVNGQPPRERGGPQFEPWGSLRHAVFDRARGMRLAVVPLRKPFTARAGIVRSRSAGCGDDRDLDDDRGGGSRVAHLSGLSSAETRAFGSAEVRDRAFSSPRKRRTRLKRVREGRSCLPGGQPEARRGPRGAPEQWSPRLGSS